MAKIKVNPVVELDGDEMTRPAVHQGQADPLSTSSSNITPRYRHRDATNDQVTIDLANAISKKYGVGGMRDDHAR